MARTFQTGFELGNLHEWTDWSAVGGLLGLRSSSPRSGSYSLSGCANNAKWVKKTLPAASRLHVRFGFRVEEMTGASNCGLLQLMNGASPQFSLDLANDTLLLTAKGGAARGGSALASASDPISIKTWHCLELQCICSPSAASGAFRVRLDNEPHIDWAGSANYGNGSTMNALWLGLAPDDSDPWNKFWWDDIAVNDDTGTVNNSWINDGKVIMLVPTASGTYTEWARGGSDSGSNWAQVDELPPNDDGDYVSASAPGETDTYVMSDPGLTAGSPDCVEVWIWAKKSDAGSQNLASYIILSGSELEGSSRAPATDYDLYIQRYETIPWTDVEWTLDDLNDLEVGITIP